MKLKFALVPLAAMLLLAACNLKVRESEGKEGEKNVSMSTPLGNLKVRTDDVNPADTGMSVYPGSRLKPKQGSNDSKANVDINTPWFGVKVVALTYESDDSIDKIWNYYRDEMSKKWGKPLECKPGSPDLKKEKQNNDDLTCAEKDGKQGIDIDADTDDMKLKVGSKDRQHIVAMKKEGGKTKYSLVYVSTRGEKDTI